MLRRSLSIITAFQLLLLSCGSGTFIREKKPLVRADVEMQHNRGLIRTLFSDVYAEELSTGDFRALLQDPYFRKKTDTDTFRIPPVEIFFCVIKTTWKYPVTLRSAEISYKQKTLPSLKAEDIRRRLPSPLYESINFKNILMPHRVMQDGCRVEAFIKNKDFLRYELGFITPGDSVAYIFIFPRLPVSVRNFNLRIMLKSLNRKKMIDFEFTRLEYRSQGKDFRKKEQRGMIE